MKCKMQDNLEFCQWLKKFWDANWGGDEYDAIGRRGGQASDMSVNACLSDARPQC